MQVSSNPVPERSLHKRGSWRSRGPSVSAEAGGSRGGYAAFGVPEASLEDANNVLAASILSEPFVGRLPGGRTDGEVVNARSLAELPRLRGHTSPVVRSADAAGGRQQRRKDLS